MVFVAISRPWVINLIHGGNMSLSAERVVAGSVCAGSTQNAHMSATIAAAEPNSLDEPYA